jgi:Na+-translocating ferredoxin:NAD+ oxidoreductase RNF subunit RnfB
MSKYFHSVTLDADKCKGCINCLKRCPTEAIRVREGKAHIRKDHCIDCGECVRICPHHAKKATYDPMAAMEGYKYKIALPPPSLYAQFNRLEDKALVIDALYRLGFDDVFEVATAAEMVSEQTRNILKDKSALLPLISSACPSVVSLICVRFPNLVKHISRVPAPVSLAAGLAVQKALRQTGYPRKEIGVFFITPCPAKVAYIYDAKNTDHPTEVDAALSISEVYPLLLSAMKQAAGSSNNGGISSVRQENPAGRIGVSWGGRGGEASGLIIDRYLAADGIENVIRVLNDLEDDKLRDVDFIELNACSGGCVGGVLAVENPFIANVKLNHLRKYLPVSGGHLGSVIPPEYLKTQSLKYSPVFEFGKTVSESIRIMRQIDAQAERLPGLDCGCCGAPTCRAHAEDIVRGYSNEMACIHLFRKAMSDVGKAAETDGNEAE